MFSQTWKKYLPVISILIKRSAQGDQILALNNTDFDRAAGGRKIKYSFTHLQLNKGRINTDHKHTPFAKEFSVVLQEDENVQRLLAPLSLEFTLNNQLQLTIKNLAAEVAIDEPENVDAEATLEEKSSEEVLTTEE
jgi:hypothetical protein